ncbi:MAG: CpaD family pilus assembly protein [Alphaproteobacteria bacterium]
MREHGRSGARRLLAGACLALALSACADMTPDHRTRHQNVVVRQPFTLMMTVPEAATGVGAGDSDRIARFVESYRRRGEGMMEVTVGEGSGGREAALAIGDVLVAAGLRAEEVGVRFAPASAQGGEGTLRTAMLSFQGYVVQPPQCGDWSQSSSFRPENSPTGNFGCATQRNIGLMVRDPRDLIRSADVSGSDGQRHGDIMTKYRTSKVTGNETDVRVTVSDVGKK